MFRRVEPCHRIRPVPVSNVLSTYPVPRTALLNSGRKAGSEKINDNKRLRSLYISAYRGRPPEVARALYVRWRHRTATIGAVFEVSKVGVFVHVRASHIFSRRGLASYRIPESRCLTPLKEPSWCMLSFVLKDEALVM